MKNDYIPVVDGTIYKDKIYFYITETNGLYAIDINVDEIEFLGEIPWGIPGKPEQYLSIVGCANAITLIPYNEKNLVIYDINSKDFKKKSIDSDETKMAGFMANCVVGEKLYIFGTYEPTILCYDYTNDQIISLNGFENDPKYRKVNDDVFFRQQILVHEDRIYAPFCNADGVLIIDTDSLEQEVVPLGRGSCGYAGITGYDNLIWLAPRNLFGDIVAIDFDGKLINRYSLRNVYGEIEGTFIAATGVEVLNLYSSADIKEEVISEVPIIIKGSEYGFAHQIGDRVIAFSRSLNSISILENNETVYNKEISLNLVGKNIGSRIKTGILEEDKFANLDDYIKTIIGNN